MNIISKLTLRHLKENKRRTLVTIIGVIISVAMLTAVSTLGVSFMALFQQQEIANTGEWHALYRDVNEEQLAMIHADDNTESIILSRDAGYANLKGSENNYKPYLFVREYNESGFEKFPIDLIEGRLPRNETELIISKHIETNGKVNFELGETINLAIGERQVALNDDYLDQSRSLRTDDDLNVETLSDQQTKQFTIVGVMARPSWEPIVAPGYTVLTYLSEDYLTSSEPVNVSVVWNKINRSALENAEKLGQQLNIDAYSFNSNLLRYYGVINQGNLRATLFSLVGIIMSVIVVGSVSLIYNAFAISVSERSRHLGMLSSVGATEKQKRNSVFFEGAVIGLISIPLGIISGLVGIGITFYFINDLILETLDMTGTLKVVVTPMSIILACAVSLLTIFISTYIPAKRASKVSAIDAIRQTMDVKTTSKKLKTSRLVRKLFGIEAEFGLKNLKRNKRRYSVVVFSLVVSIVLFLTVSFFTDQIRKTAGYTQSGFNYDISLESYLRDGSAHQFSDTFIDSVTSIDEITDDSFIQEVYLETNLKPNQIPDEFDLFDQEDEYHFGIDMYVLDKESLQTYAEAIGVDEAELTDENKMTGIIINRALATGKKYGETTAIQMIPGESLEIIYDDWQADNKIALGDLEVVALTDKIPLGVRVNYQHNLNIIVSEETFSQLNKADQITEVLYALYLTSSDPLAVHEKLEELKESNMYIYNHHRARQEEERSLLLISVFIYGFIILITAISVANIFNTISTSISLRKQEFAMLKSVGMTPKGFNKMINYESIFYGIKALLYGLPISLAVMYLIYLAMDVSFEYPFEIPWLTILYTFIAVFFIVGSAMLYSGSKVKKENIIDGLKQENL